MLAQVVAVAQAPKPYLDVQVYDATAPASGAVQAIVVLTDPKPITSGDMRFEFSQFFELAGVALFSDSGDVAGAAERRSSYVRVRFTSPSGTFGLSTAYLPIMILTLEVPDKAERTQVPMALHGSSFWRDTLGNLYPTQVKHGLFTIGGSVSITNVVPGSGLVKAGDVLTIRGVGFKPGVTAWMAGVPLSSVRVVSSGLIQAAIGSDASLDWRKLYVTNPDLSTAEYYLYPRHQAYGRTEKAPFAAVYPIFARQTYTEALYGPLRTGSAGSKGTTAAVALLNPQGSSAAATVEVFSPAMVRLNAGTITVPSGMYALHAISEIVEECSVPAGGYVRVAAPQALRILMMIAEGENGPVTPVNALRAN